MSEFRYMQRNLLVSQQNVTEWLIEQGYGESAQSNAKIIEIENNFNIITPCYKNIEQANKLDIHKNNRHHAELQIRL